VALERNGNGSNENAEPEGESADAQDDWAASVLRGFDDPPEVRQRRIKRAEDERRRRALGGPDDA
jgi:hypothetical protein